MSGGKAIPALLLDSALEECRPEEADQAAGPRLVSSPSGSRAKQAKQAQRQFVQTSFSGDGPEEGWGDSEKDGAGNAPCCRKQWASLPYLASWMACSMSMLLFNKKLFRGGSRGFPYPLTLVLIHQASLGAVLLLLRAFSPAWLMARVMPTAGREMQWNEYLRVVVPIAMCQVLAMSSQNVALQLTSVHFVVMVSAVKPVLVCILQAAFGLAPLSRTSLQIVTAISFGVLLAVAGEVQLVVSGLLLLVVAQVMEGLRIVLMQRSMTGEKELDAATLLSYTSPVCSMALAPLVLFTEFQTMEDDAFEQLGLPSLLMSVVLAGGVNCTSSLVIQKTDALVLVLAGIVKDFAVIFVSAWLFSAKISPGQLAGYSVAVAFINVYREFKKNEAEFASRGLVMSMLGMALPRALLDRSTLPCASPSPRSPAPPNDGRNLGPTCRCILAGLVIAVTILGAAEAIRRNGADEYTAVLRSAEAERMPIPPPAPTHRGSDTEG